ncbi:hypothetical protein BLA29_000476 [Euroglyphus maynei]|uniref:Uncharacterized protein n=1 Tax=Euroglyphus maynei TaxID=6958 RepID=A0A1Y3AX09_EURMA|nr:hypothetical protein BLA29_000476 [Euroglyphus maynei]
MVIIGLTRTEAKQKDGKFATILEDYHSTIKCVINIAEETIPELDDYVACCGFWAINDWLQHKVSEECEEENVKQVQHLSGLIEPQIRPHCKAYERGSFTCRMLIIMPIAMVVLFILFVISFCVCAHVSLYKWIQVRRKYRRVVNLGLQSDEPFMMNKKSEKNGEKMNNDYEQSSRYKNRP